ncbi:hypothetical protein BKA59DRAFT_493841 [Fusarium tricinctum]|uniref:Uncharacterized protein n=1 Tax=Fusarium tricinctum TaxID=61284 RepID=A0A8K0W9N2_9HYPO|nr:hypothetical protein BKA59DRAFT_493841 [Fusarium tricinctum]
MNIVSTINLNPSGASGSGAHSVSLLNTFDQASRKYTVFVGEYASIRTGSNTNGQVGAQSFGMACAEAVFLLCCERNLDYDEEPGIVALIKHTANEILYSMRTATLPVTATRGTFGPVYWSATSNGAERILKLVNYNGLTGLTNAVEINMQGSIKTTAQLSMLTASNTRGVLSGKSRKKGGIKARARRTMNSIII